MRYVAIFLITVFLQSQVLSGEHQFVKVPKVAKTRDELVESFGKTIGFGSVSRAEFARGGRQLFAAWYCPFSGRGDVYLHAYYYDPKEMQWILFIDRLLNNPGELSAEMPPWPEQIIFRDASGKILVSESIAKLPAEEIPRNEAQPDGAAKGSQPIGSETNSTSSAAGSRR